VFSGFQYSGDTSINIHSAGLGVPATVSVSQSRQRQTLPGNITVLVRASPVRVDTLRPNRANSQEAPQKLLEAGHVPSPPPRKETLASSSFCVFCKYLHACSWSSSGFTTFLIPHSVRLSPRGLPTDEKKLFPFLVREYLGSLSQQKGTRNDL
jgi:hypothetical protein